MGKNAKKYLIIVLIIAIIYNVLVFAIPYPHKSAAVFWTAWSGGLIAILAQPLIAHLGFKDAETLKSKVYGWPIIRIGYIYLAVQLIITLIFLIVGAFVVIPAWILPILIIILIGFTVIGLFVSDTYREEIEKLEQGAPITTKFINDLTVDTRMLADSTNNHNIKTKLEKLAEEVRFSDPVSSEALLEIEDEINRKFLVLKDNVNNNLLDNFDNDVEGLILLIKERNQRAKLAKR